ncbi:SOS response-associated peptidase family protein [Pseudomonas sp. AA4]|uniref:SOS response-associated peptidase n=1 Tax=unclassified Pseudomonas TaxID=196821 RepID=UPI002B232CD4|nr:MULTISPECIES: SOS response-associated peptidase family protein [unclassified Pseudomonas]MEA9996442.1 SOS response-associated peptidase family protein [Pseudomonas sp. AA4]MEB0222149.1 SOS response-associated peptidase family protein [Pseudomonas sp. AB12(2023)]
MCSHYEAPTQSQLALTFGIEFNEQGKLDLWPGYFGPFIRRSGHTDPQDEASPILEMLLGSFGLIPGWSKDAKIARRTYNARSETVAEKPSYKNAWRRAQHCIIPAAAIYEPDWRTGTAIATRITRSDSELMGIAGIWERWHSAAGEIVHSYSMLTVNADNHAFMRNYHKPSDEKRMVVILPKGLYNDWLNAPASASADFMQKYPADRLAVTQRA